MSNLLDRASVVLTPTAYNNGEALCIKPDDASGDFQFYRNSAATRVNAQGLVENVQILSGNLVQNGDFSELGSEEISNGSFSQEGVELITNGDFSNGSTGWELNPSSGTAIVSNGKLNFTNSTSSGTQVQQKNRPYVIGKTYKITFTVTDYIQGGIRLSIGNNLTTSVSANGTFTQYITYTNGLERNYIYTSGSTGSIDNVSVKEVGQDWSLLNAELTNNGVIIGQPDGSISQFGQFGVFTIGKQYKLTYDILEDNGGVFSLAAPSTILTTTLGSHTIYLTANSADLFIKRSSASTTTKTTFTNISVKEVGQNWTLGTSWSIGDDKVIAVDAPFNNSISQNISIVAGKKYKISFNISDYVKGNVRVNVGNAPSNTVSSNGSFTFVLDAFNTAPLFIQTWAGGSGTTLSITNISVIEITDDTNLPRINYEGFSYQDALGSEEIVNGGFDNGSANWTVAGGNPIFENSSVNFVDFSTINSNNLVVETGKTYKITYTISNKVGSSVFGFFLGGWNTAQHQEIGTHSEIIDVSSSSVIYIRNGNSNSSVTIDNVSVKEYLGQVPIPNSGCGSWLFEPQSTNLITYSEDFEGVGWTLGAGLISSNTTDILSPEGVYNSTKISSASYISVYYSGISVTPSTQYTFSFYAKKGDFDNAKLAVYDGTNSSFISVDISYSVTDTQWTRIEHTFTTPAGCTDIRIYPMRGVSSGSIYFWGAQVEQQSYATSYIPTSGTSVTRNQDVCNNGGSLASINSTEGVLYVLLSDIKSQDFDSIIINNGIADENNQVRIWFYNNTITYQYKVGSNVSAQITTSTMDLTLDTKIACSWKLNEFKLFVNGSKINQDLSGSVLANNTLESVEFKRGNNTGNFYGKTKALAVWKEALSDEELTELTTI